MPVFSFFARKMRIVLYTNKKTKKKLYTRAGKHTNLRKKQKYVKENFLKGEENRGSLSEKSIKGFWEKLYTVLFDGISKK